MRKWHNEKITGRFHQLKAMFDAGNTEVKYHLVTEEGILCYGELVFRKERSRSKHSRSCEKSFMP